MRRSIWMSVPHTTQRRKELRSRRNRLGLPKKSEKDVKQKCGNCENVSITKEWEKVAWRPVVSYQKHHLKHDGVNTRATNTTQCIPPSPRGTCRAMLVRWSARRASHEKPMPMIMQMHIE